LSISDSCKWRVNKPAYEILKLVKNELFRKNATLRGANLKRIEATFGSEAKTRLFGGLFVSEETLPVKITQMNETAKETEIDATIRDDLGVGSRWGMRGKYRGYIDNLFNLLSTVLENKN
jgi:hypothetical protein